jgi:cell division protein FtsQ
VTLAQGVRSGNLFSKRDSTVLNAPEPNHAQKEGASAGLKRRAAVTEMPLPRDASYANDYADTYDSDPEFMPQSRRPAVRLSFRDGLVPSTLWGRIAAAAGFVMVVGAAIAGALWVRSFLLHDEHFIVPNSAAIQTSGNSHLTRGQLLSIFGEDVDRNLFNIPLEERRAELESLPWVAHATVMRLMPDRVKVAIVERTPVAFVRQGKEIELVDANGAIFDLPGPDLEDSSGTAAGPGSTAPYSFPVLSGILATDPLSTRAARMKIYLEFMAALDAGGEGVSHHVSEVNISNPEDVQAIIPDSGSNSADILVHFGQEKYLERYHQYQAYLAEWRTQYPKLASVDMRYEQQVVLEMQRDAATGSVTATSSGDAAGSSGLKPEATKLTASAKHPQGAKPRVAKLKPKSKPAGRTHAQAAWHAPTARTPAQGVGQ